MGIKSFFKDIFTPTKRVLTHLDEETIKRDEQLRKQQVKISAMESYIARDIANKKKIKEEENKEQKQNQINKKFVEQKKELDAYKYGKIVYLSKFYQWLRETKAQVELRDNNNRTVLGKFKDIVLLGGGKLGIIDQDGEIRAMGSKLTNIMYDPDSFENMFRDKRILLPVDENGNWETNMDYTEINEIKDYVTDSNGNVVDIVWNERSLTTIKDILIESKQRENELSEELELSDLLVVKLKAEINNLSRALKIAQSTEEKTQSHLSSELSKVMEISKRTEEMHSQIVKLMELKSTHEQLLQQKDDLIERVISKLDLTGDPKIDRERERIKSELEWAKSVLPEKVEIKQESLPEERKQFPQPGEIIKR